MGSSLLSPRQCPAYTGACLRRNELGVRETRARGNGAVRPSVPMLRGKPRGMKAVFFFHPISLRESCGTGAVFISLPILMRVLCMMFCHSSQDERSLHITSLHWPGIRQPLNAVYFMLALAADPGTMVKPSVVAKQLHWSRIVCCMVNESFNSVAFSCFV